VSNRSDRNSASFGIVFDGDDTLWRTEQLYDDARSAAAAIVSESCLDASAWETLERHIDVENVAVLGHSVERFPRSCAEAYQKLCETVGRIPDTSVAERIRQAARSAFLRPAPPIDGANETLSTLRSRGHRLALLTKGDESVQARRIEQSGLRQYFDLVRIVSEKSAAEIKKVVTLLGRQPGSSWMVGNSIRSDILPALEAGLRAIWIEAHVWEYERLHERTLDNRVVIVRQLPDLLKVITI
jgi:putative hydrolase of the HAD superfamily